MKTITKNMLFLLLLSFVTVASASAPALAGGPVYGPVSTTVNSANYSVYYTTVPYSQVVENIPGIPDPTIKGSTTSPYLLTGIAAASPKFVQPWWDPTNTRNSSAAALAAQTWYNFNGPLGQGVKFPNANPPTPPAVATPYYVYATDSSGSVAYYATVDYPSGVVRLDQVDVDQIGVSFALAAASN